jgi:hypothetical protein
MRNARKNFGRIFSQITEANRFSKVEGQGASSEAREESDQCAERMSSLHAFIGELLERGVPREWIEEALGARLEAA